MNIKELEKLWSEYYPKVFGYFYRRVESRTDAEDLTSIVMEKYLDVLDNRGEEIQNPHAYLWRIANNQLSYFLKYRAKTPMSVGVSDETDTVDLSLDQYRSEAYQQKIQALMDCIRHYLKDTDYQIVYNSLVMDKKSYEVAEDVGLKPDNVRKRLSRSLDKVRQKCKDLWLE